MKDMKFFTDGTVVHEPKNTVHIDAVWAVLSVDPKDNTEGIVAFNTPEGAMPLLAADPARVESILGVARDMKRYTNHKMMLVKFTSREDVETL